MTPRALFTDIGGVLLTNGWDTDIRKTAVEHFHLDQQEIDSRHRMTFDTYEIGKIPLSTYLERVVFYEPRPFTPHEFTEWLLDQSQAYPEMLDLLRGLRKKFGLKVAVISNEGRELTEFRIKKFRLTEFVDYFCSSCFVHLRKPDTDMFRLALDMMQVPAEEAVYLEDRPLFVEVAGTLGIRGIRHTDYASTKLALANFGLNWDESVAPPSPS